MQKSVATGKFGAKVSYMYDDEHFKPKSFVKMIYSFENPNSNLQKAFPIYAVSHRSVNRGNTPWPWVCWGKSYDWKGESWSNTVSLEDALHINEGD